MIGPAVPDETQAISMRVRTRPLHLLVVLALVLVSTAVVAVAGPASADVGPAFVAVAHSDAASTKFKAVPVSGAGHVGDTAVMVFTQGSTVTWTGPTGVTGWTQLGTFTSGGLTSTAWSKVLAAGDVGATVRFDTTGFAKAMLSVAVYSGVATSPPVVAHAADSAVTSHVSPSVAASDGSWVVSYWADKSETTSAWTAPAGVTQRDVAIGTGTGHFSSLWADTGGPVAAGAYGGKAAATDVSTRALMWSIVLAPASVTPPVNQPPVASFTQTCTDLSCTVDGGGSHDPDGTITSYAWDFGDSTTGTGATPPAHVYGSAGSYLVQLTVTDDDDAPGTTSHQVTVTVSTGGSIAFVGVSHSDATAAKFKSAVVPGTAHAGDTAVMFFTQASTVTWTGPTGVTGWAQLGTFTAGGLTSTSWSKVLTPADVGATVRFDTAASAKGMLSVADYSGVAAGAPVVAHSSDSATTSHVAPSLPVTAGSWVLSYWADKSDTTSTWTPPAGVTGRDVAIGTGAGHFSSLLADSGGPVPAGSYSAKVATTDVSTRALMWTVGLSAGGAPPANGPITKLMVIMEENETTAVLGRCPTSTDWPRPTAAPPPSRPWCTRARATTSRSCPVRAARPAACTTRCPRPARSPAARSSVRPSGPA